MPWAGNIAKTMTSNGKHLGFRSPIFFVETTHFDIFLKTKLWSHKIDIIGATKSVYVGESN